MTMQGWEGSMADEEPYSDLITEEIRRLEAVNRRGGFRLRFSALLEKQFRAFYARTFKNYRRASLMIALLVIGAVGLLDIVVFGEHWGTIARIRYGAGLPFVAIVAVMVFSPYFERLQQQLVTLSCLFVAHMATILLLVGPDSAYALYLAAYILLALFAGVIARLFFHRAAAIMIFAAVEFNLLIFLWRPQPIEIIASYNAYFLCGALMALAANYYMELSARKEFIHFKLLSLERNQLKEANVKLQHMATIDPLTGVDNRRQLDRNLDAEWRRGRRSGQPLSLIMLDIDYFKKYNDGYGHQAGDVCLEKVANEISETFKRSSDTVARYGGEEFAVLLPESNEEQAQQLADTLCENIRAMSLPHQYSQVADHITISVGVASMIPSAENHYEDLVREADKSLYAAKERGRDQAVAASSL